MWSYRRRRDRNGATQLIAESERLRDQLVEYADRLERYVTELQAAIEAGGDELSPPREEGRRK